MTTHHWLNLLVKKYVLHNSFLEQGKGLDPVQSFVINLSKM